MLGAALVPHLVASGHDVIHAPSRTRASRRADLSQREHVDRMLSDAQPDVVVNLAALADVDYCESHPVEAYATNVELVHHVAQWVASSSRPCRLVHISSDQMYDGPAPNDERFVRPCNYYGFSKLLSEQYAALVGATTLRTNFFGRSRAAGSASLSDWIIAAAREERDITVFDDVRFTPLSMLTLAESLAQVIARPTAGTFNLGASEGMSKADFAFAILETLGLPTTHVRRGSVYDAPRTARRPREMRMSSARFHETFGGAAPALRDEIARAAAEYR